MLNTFESNTPIQMPKKNRELDIELAKLLGYKTRALVEGNNEIKGRYILSKPVCSGFFAGLKAIRSHEAQRKHKEADWNIGTSESDTWQWVPEFTTNFDHHMTLHLHMRHSEKIIISNDDYGKLGMREGVEYFIQEMKKKQEDPLNSSTTETAE